MSATAPPWRRWRSPRQGLPPRQPQRGEDRCGGPPRSPSAAHPYPLGSPKQKGQQIALPPPGLQKKNLLQVGHRRQVSRELDDAGGAAPVRPERRRAVARVDRRYESRAGIGGAVIAGEGVAGGLGEVGVGVAQIQREHLVGEAYADIPGVVARLLDAERERSAKRRCDGRAIERIRGSEPLTAELTGDVHADAAAAEGRARCGPFAGDRSVVAPGAEVQEVWRGVLVDTELPLVVDGDVNLAIDFVEAGAPLGEVAVDGQTAGDLAEIDALAESGAITL